MQETLPGTNKSKLTVAKDIPPGRQMLMTRMEKMGKRVSELFTRRSRISAKQRSRGFGVGKLNPV